MEGSTDEEANEISEQLAALSVQEEFSSIHRMQEMEVLKANEKLWRRNLMYQVPIIRTCRQLVRVEGDLLGEVLDLIHLFL